MNTVVEWVYEDWEGIDYCFFHVIPLPMSLNSWRCPVDQIVHGVAEGSEGALKVGVGWE